MTIRSRITLLALSGLCAAAASTGQAQESRVPRLYDTTGAAWVYASYYQVSWSRVDSLLKLQRFRSAWRDRAVQAGCYLDSNLLIHQTGNEYNVVISTTYPSFRYIGPGAERSGCANEAWRAVVPDSSLRAAIAAGNRWVFQDGKHYDVIYWVPYPRTR